MRILISIRQYLLPEPLPNPQDLYISRPVTQVYFPPPLNFSESRRIQMLSRSRACRARAYAWEFASVAEGGLRCSPRKWRDCVHERMHACRQSIQSKFNTATDENSEFCMHSISDQFRNHAHACTMQDASSSASDVHAMHLFLNVPHGLGVPRDIHHRHRSL